MMKFIEDGGRGSRCLWLTNSRGKADRMDDLISLLGKGADAKDTEMTAEDAALIEVVRSKAEIEEEAANIRVDTVYKFVLQEHTKEREVVGDRDVLRQFLILNAVKQIASAFPGYEEDALPELAVEIGNEIARLKNLGISPELVRSCAEKLRAKGGDGIIEIASAIADVYQKYEEKKTALGIVDYNDVVAQAAEKLKKNSRSMRRYDYVVMDGAQDISKEERRFVMGLGKKVEFLEDTAQEIYTFRTGGNPHSMLEESTGAKEEEAEKTVAKPNFRNRPEIWTYATRLTLKNALYKKEFEKRFEGVEATRERGGFIKLVTTGKWEQADAAVAEAVELEKEGKKNIAILAGANWQLRQVADRLSRLKIGYGGKVQTEREEDEVDEARVAIINFFKALTCRDNDSRSLLKGAKANFMPAVEMFELADAMVGKVVNSDSLLMRLRDPRTLTNDMLRNGVWETIIDPWAFQKRTYTRAASEIRERVAEFYESGITPTRENFFDYLSLIYINYTPLEKRGDITLKTVHKAVGDGYDYVIYLPYVRQEGGISEAMEKVIEELEGQDAVARLKDERTKIDYEAFTRGRDGVIVVPENKLRSRYFIRGLVNEEKQKEIEIPELAPTPSATQTSSVGENRKGEGAGGRMREDIRAFFKNFTNSISYSFLKALDDPYEFWIEYLSKQYGISDAARKRMRRELMPNAEKVDLGGLLHKLAEQSFAVEIPDDDVPEEARPYFENMKKAFDKMAELNARQIHAEYRIELEKETGMFEDVTREFNFSGLLDTVFKIVKDGKSKFIIVDYKSDSTMVRKKEYHAEMALHRSLLAKRLSTKKHVFNESDISVKLAFIGLEKEETDEKTGGKTKKIQKLEMVDLTEEELAGGKMMNVIGIKRLLEYIEDPSKYIADLLKVKFSAEAGNAIMRIIKSDLENGTDDMVLLARSSGRNPDIFSALMRNPSPE